MSESGFNSARVQWHAKTGIEDSQAETDNSISPVQYSLMGQRELSVCDERRHSSGVHGGSRKVLQANLSLPSENFSNDALEVHSLAALLGDLS